MKKLPILLGLLGIAVAGWSQEKALSPRPEATSRNLQAWVKTFDSFDDRPPEVQEEILAAIVQFSDSFKKLVEALPEYKVWEAETQKIITRIDGSTKEQLDILRVQIDQVQLEFAKPLNRIAEDSVSRMTQTLKKGLSEDDLSTRAAAHETLFTVAELRFRPSQSARFLCRLGITSYGDAFAEAITALMLQEAVANPRVFIGRVNSRQPGYGAAAVALSESRIPSAKPVVIRLLESKEPEAFGVGCECALAWPLPEFLPKLIAQWIDPKAKNESFEEEFQSATRSFGPAALKAILRVWPKMTEERKEGALRVASSLPCKDALNLIFRALEDESAQVRTAAVGVLLDPFDDEEWDEDYQGPNPNDLTEVDKERVRQALPQMLQDKDREVVQAAREQLERLQTPPTPTR